MRAYREAGASIIRKNTTFDLQGLNNNYPFHNSTNQLNFKKKRFIRKTIREYCELIDKKEFEDSVVFQKESYTCGQEDFFNEGTIINKSFINNQNTPFMKRKAERYSIVITIQLVWHKKK